jgi:molybdenum cofactor cytidylyltransferase
LNPGFMNGIWAIILAAGESKRMGSPKLVLPFRGKTIIENVIENISRSEVENIVLVLGADSEKIIKAVEGMDVKHCYNENYSQGMLSSVKCGFSSLPHHFRVALVFQGDQPMIGPDITNALINAYKKSGKGIIIPTFEKKRGHPLLLDSKYRDNIMKLDGGEGLRAIAYRFPHDVFEVKVNTQNVLKDIDTEEDYISEMKQIKQI